jgi:hypothetical protein
VYDSFVHSALETFFDRFFPDNSFFSDMFVSLHAALPVIQREFLAFLTSERLDPRALLLLTSQQSAWLDQIEGEAAAGSRHDDASNGPPPGFAPEASGLHNDGQWAYFLLMKNGELQSESCVIFPQTCATLHALPEAQVMDGQSKFSWLRSAPRTGACASIARSLLPTRLNRIARIFESGRRTRSGRGSLEIASCSTRAASMLWSIVRRTAASCSSLISSTHSLRS